MPAGSKLASPGQASQGGQKSRAPPGSASLLHHPKFTINKKSVGIGGTPEMCAVECRPASAIAPAAYGDGCLSPTLRSHRWLARPCPPRAARPRTALRLQEGAGQAAPRLLANDAHPLKPVYRMSLSWMLRPCKPASQQRWSWRRVRRRCLPPPATLRPLQQCSRCLESCPAPACLSWSTRPTRLWSSS